MRFSKRVSFDPRSGSINIGNKEGEISRALYKILKGEKMPENISPSGQYMLGVYNLKSPEDVRFVKIILLSAVENTIKNAKYHYLHYFLKNPEEAGDIRFAFCVSLEYYLRAALGEKETIKIEE